MVAEESVLARPPKVIHSEETPFRRRRPALQSMRGTVCEAEMEVARRSRRRWEIQKRRSTLTGAQQAQHSVELVKARIVER